jgi:hypothetical protein
MFGQASASDLLALEILWQKLRFFLDDFDSFRQVYQNRSSRGHLRDVSH